MKRLLLALWLGCWVLGTAAQEKTVVLTPVKKGEEPEAIIKALKEDFPNTLMDNMKFLPGKLYGDEWNIDLQGDPNLDINYYQVHIKKQNEYFTAIYNKSGELLSSKHIIDNAVLPKPVNETIKSFAGWHVDKEQEIIEYHNKHKKIRDVYKVKLQQGAKHKFVFINPNGQIAKERFTVDIG